MNEEKGARKKCFFSRIFEKIDKKMQEKAKKGKCCCNSDAGEDKKDRCCS